MEPKTIPTKEQPNEDRLFSFPQELHETILSLPKELQDVFLSPTLNEKIRVIIGDQPLDAQQQSDLETEIFLVLMKLESTLSFVTNVTHNVRISRERADKISKDVMKEIFNPVINLLYKGNASDGMPTQTTNNTQRVSNTKPAVLGSKPETEDATGFKKVPSDIIQQRTQPQPTYSRNTAPDTRPSNVFENKLSGPMLMKNEEEKVDVESRNDDKPKHVDPYREPTD